MHLIEHGSHFAAGQEEGRCIGPAELRRMLVVNTMTASALEAFASY